MAGDFDTTEGPEGYFVRSEKRTREGAGDVGVAPPRHDVRPSAASREAAGAFRGKRGVRRTSGRRRSDIAMRQHLRWAWATFSAGCLLSLLAVATTWREGRQ